jgi:hypothetical protein
MQRAIKRAAIIRYRFCRYSGVCFFRELARSVFSRLCCALPSRRRRDKRRFPASSIRQPISNRCFTSADQNVYEIWWTPGTGPESGFHWVDETADSGAPQAIVVYAIRGQVTAGGSGLSGVTVTLSGTTAAGTSVSLSTTTDANGNYSFSVPVGGTYADAVALRGTRSVRYRPNLTI